MQNLSISVASVYVKYLHLISFLVDMAALHITHGPSEQKITDLTNSLIGSFFR